jgi:drug/metabolite transporter (DMT)-like permease
MAVGDTSTATHLHHTQHDARRDHLTGIGYGVAAGALWGVIFVAPKMLPQFSPLALSAARYVLYGVLSLALALPVWRTLWSKPTRRDWVALLLLSLPGNILYTCAWRVACSARAWHRCRSSSGCCR